jgi:prepilin-type processing-associated H-X9-DG protein
VVIGIIAVLIGILLPALGRAREAAKSTACLSNIRQVSIALIMYANDNRGFLPASSRGGSPMEADFMQYRADRDLDKSVIGKYLGKIVDRGGTNSGVGLENRSFNRNVMRCPSDDWDRKRQRLISGDPNADYRFSYVMNQYIGAGYLYSHVFDRIPYPGFIDAGSGSYAKDAAGKITQVKRPSEKMMLFEEAEATIDDGHATADLGTKTNLLAIRHDRRRQNPEPTGALSSTTTDILRSKFNGELKGNVGFCDGSARNVSRVQMHSPDCYLPRK